MEFLQAILEQSEYSFLTAFILGLMTAISPCPLATNITAIGFISRNVTNKRRVFMSGIVYTLGRAFSYSVLALAIFFGASKMDISMLFQGWGEKLLGPLLVIIGVFMLNIISIPFPSFSSLTEKLGKRAQESYIGSFLLGCIFALAFCPYSGVLYFAMLLPITISSAGGLYLPIIFAIATGIPVILFAWLLAFAVTNVGKIHIYITNFEKWFRKIVAILFIGVGVYYIVIFFLQ